MIGTILLSVVIALVAFLVIKEVIQLYYIFKMKRKNSLVVYVPIVGPFIWYSVIRADPKDTFGWIKKAMREAEARKADLLITNDIFGFSPSYMPLSPEMLRGVYKDEISLVAKENITDSPLFELGIFLKNEPKHIAMRGVFSDIFRSENLRKVSVAVQDIAKRNLQELANQDLTKVDIKDSISNIFLGILDEVLFGCNEDRVRGKQLSRSIIDFIETTIGFQNSIYAVISLGNSIKWTFIPTVRDLYKWRKEISDVILARYQEVMKSGKTDNSFLGNMARFNLKNTENAISNEDLVGNVILFVFAAYDTTRHSTTWGLYHISSKAELQETLRSELTKLDLSKDEDYEIFDSHPLLESVVKEILRLSPPLMTTELRVVQKDFEMMGFKFKKGDQMSFPAGMAGIKAEYEDSFEFKPDRFMPNGKKYDRMSFLPFSHGRRACIGQYLANMNMKIIILEALRQYRLTPVDFEVLAGNFPFNSMKNCYVSLTAN